MIEDARPAVILSTTDRASGLPERAPVMLLNAAERRERAVAKNANREPKRTSSFSGEHAAYVIYTSGSTGRPKGTVITQASMSAFIVSMIQAFAAQRLQHVWATTSISFDVSVFEIFAPLCAGGSIRMVPDLLNLAQQRQNDWNESLVSGIRLVIGCGMLLFRLAVRSKVASP